MTALCGGGTSSAQPGYGEVVYVLPAALGAFLNNIPTIWAVGAAGYIGKIAFNMASFCSTDPPAVPTFTAQDVIDIFNPYNPFTYTNAQQKFQDLVGAFMWHDLCKCDNGTVPTRPTPPAEPTGAPDVNPPAVGPVYPTGGVCQAYTFSGHNVGGDASVVFPWLDLNGATYFAQDWTSTPDHTTFDQMGGGPSWRNAAGTSVAGTSIVGTSGSGLTAHSEIAVPAGATQWRYVVNTGALETPALDWSVNISFYCGTTPSSPSTGPVPLPCPSDPFVQATLDQILALVTIIQRQQVPFAYIPGAVHAGLTGDGHFDVQGLIGLKLQVDSYGSAVGQLAGDPMEFYDAGWFAWGGPDGYSSREFISHSPQISLPAAAGQYTSIGYSLGHDVQVTITELIRES